MYAIYFLSIIEMLFYPACRGKYTYTYIMVTFNGFILSNDFYRQD